jgi:hypothetical protein
MATPPIASPPPTRSLTPTAPLPVTPKTGPISGTPTVPIPVAQRPAPTAPTPHGSQPAAPTGRTPINPFLANDPNAKARRLARALVSDLIVYFPQKREEGLREGTLKQVFREEIRKSFEEFVGQVGKEFAETTPHFTEALNEILAGGKVMFDGPYAG